MALVVSAMSSKRKAAEVERLVGKRPHPPLDRGSQYDEEDEDEQQPQHLKKHVQHSPLVLQHSTSNSPIDTAQRHNGDVSTSLPSSPHTAPLPAELHTPPAIDDGLLASLTLSPLSSSVTRRITTSTKPAAGVPSSPLSARAAGDNEAAAAGKAERSRLRTALPPVPSLVSHPTPVTSERPVRNGEPAIQTSFAASSAAPAPDEAAADSVRSGTSVPRPATSGSSESLNSQAVSVDSAIRGMQTISLSSLSFATAAEVQPSTGQPPSSVPPSSSSPSLSSPTASTPASLPLIRLTLNPSRVRRTSSNEAAQGNMKKHKRSLFSPTPNQVALTQPRAPGSTDCQDKEKDEGRPSRAAKVPATATIQEQPLTVMVRAASPATDAGSERDEGASVASLETAVSMTSYSVRSPTSFASSPSPSPSPSISSSTYTASSTPIRCEICNKDLSSTGQLEDHRQGRRHQHMLHMRQSGGGFACELCGKVFTCAADQEKHLQTERHKEMVEAVGRESAEGKAGVFALACELCGVTFTGFTQQRQHLEGKKHIAMARQHEREQKVEPTHGGDESKKQERQCDDSKGRELLERDGDESLSKKRKYGRASPAVTSQSQQQQPSPTPRHILPSGSHTPPTGASPSSSSSSASSLSSSGGSMKRAQQTIRYITPPPQSQPHVLPPFRISLPSSRSVGTAGSVSSAGESGESVGSERPSSAPRNDKRPHSTHSQRWQQQMHQQHAQRQQQQVWEHTAEVDDDTFFASSYSIASSHDVAQQSPVGYASDVSYQHTSFSASPPFPPQSYPPHSMYGSPLPLPPSPYGPPVMMPPAACPPMLPPMYGFLSPSAAASLSGPLLPSHTPVTIMYPTELLLAQQYAHAHPYAAYPPVYLLPTPPLTQSMGMTMTTSEAGHVQPMGMLQVDGEQVDEQHMDVHQSMQQQQQQQVMEKVECSEQPRDEQAGAIEPISHPVTDTAVP